MSVCVCKSTEKNTAVKYCKSTEKFLREKKVYTTWGGMRLGDQGMIPELICFDDGKRTVEMRFVGQSFSGM